jgi:hypothetical protein
LGDVEAAIRDAEAAVAHADRSGDAFQRLTKRDCHAEAMHQAGRRAEAGRRFAEAEAMQAKWQPKYPLLYSLAGFHYCDWLLADAEHGAWRQVFGDRASAVPEPLIDACRAVAERAKQTIEIAEGNDWLVDIGLDHLTLARAALYAAILDGRPPGGEHVREAADLLRRSGQQDFLPRGLLTRALFRAVTGASDGARHDLNEAYEIAERGPMRLFLADIYLHRARLFGLIEGRPADYPWTSSRDDLDAAASLIAECGYGRRRDELADAEAAYARLYGAAG